MHVYDEINSRISIMAFLMYRQCQCSIKSTNGKILGTIVLLIHFMIAKNRRQKCVQCV
jgi:hypothetical protein